MEPKHEAKKPVEMRMCAEDYRKAGKRDEMVKKDEMGSDSIALLLRLEPMETQSPTGV